MALLSTTCPVCGTHYGGRPAGAKCGDLSQRQHRPCVGRLIPDAQLQAAEWRFALYPGEDRTQRIRDALDSL